MINQEMKRKMLISFLLHNISTLDLPITKPYLTIFGDLLLDNMFFVKSWSIYSIFYWRIALPLFCSVSNLGLNDWKGQCAIVWWYLGTSSSIQRKKKELHPFSWNDPEGREPIYKRIWDKSSLHFFQSSLGTPQSCVYKVLQILNLCAGIDTVVFALCSKMINYSLMKNLVCQNNL